MSTAQGYDTERNKSNRAVDAEKMNVLTREKASSFLIKQFSLTKKEADFLLDWGDFQEWHHHGTKYRKTRYYDLSTWDDPDFLSDLRKEANKSYQDTSKRAKHWYEFSFENPKFCSIELGTSEFPKNEKDFIDFYLKLQIQQKRDPRKKQKGF